MLKLFRFALLLFLCCVQTPHIYAQELDNRRIRTLLPLADTLRLDTLSIIQGSVSIEGPQGIWSTQWYRVEVDPARVIIDGLPDSISRQDSIRISYRVYPLSFGAPRYLRNRLLLENPAGKPGEVLFTERPIDNRNSLFGLDGLTRSGSISRGLTIGTNQDAVVNSSLNLQLAGKISGNIDVLAAITDENIPVQAEGNTQQLQEFDRVFIQLSNPNHKLIAGDYDVRNPEGYFMRYFKKAQGGLYAYQDSIARKDLPPLLVSGGIGAAVSRGKFSRNIINGIESNQGPYRLRGAENEIFIVVMSNSERVFIDGLLLQRGQDRDYVIDYNTAEITFTTRRLINKDMRIIVEFQYADRNYARTLLTGFAAVKDRRFRAGINVYSEQDSKNQPIQQDLSEEDKLILAKAGDSLNLAFAPGVDSVDFNINEVLYLRRDTLVNGFQYSNVYVYSTSADSAFFRLSFSNVGLGKGNYIIENNAANGRVYRWVAPVNGIPQGDYEPVIQLISPKQRQMATAWSSYDLGAASKIGVELAVTRDNLNRFSSFDKGNDVGLAARVTAEHRQPLRRSEPAGWNFVAAMQTEMNDERFRPIEVFRAVEFVRDWNLAGQPVFDKELLSNMQAGLSHPRLGDVRAGFRSFFRGDTYRGLMQVLSGNLRPGKWHALWDASLLSTSGGAVQSSFLRHREVLTRSFGKWVPGLKVEQERNAQRRPGSDTLDLNAFHFRWYEAFFGRSDSSRYQIRGSFARREDDGLAGTQFRHATTADMASLAVSWSQGSSQRFSVITNYRNLRVLDSSITSVKPEESTTARLDYNLNAAGGFLNLNTFYEGGTGREPRRLYSYIQVTPGTGNYSWIDYNGDGIPQLNEFEIAVFQDQANYIRIFNNTNEYVKVFFNQFNAVVNLNPAALYKKAERPFWTKFSILSSARFDNRILGEGGLEDWNPFPRSIADTVLLSTQSSGRYTLFFDRTGPKFAADITWQDQQQRQLLANGIETRGVRSLSNTIRWNLYRWLGIQQKTERGVKESNAQAFSNRNFNIANIRSETRINLQPGSTYRLTLSYRYEDKNNVAVEGLGERALLNDAGLEWRYNSARKGLVSARFNLVQISYTGALNTAIAFEMLEGLRAGTNITWGFNIQRNLGNSLQLSLNYEGRRPEGLKTVHTGGAQVRAFF